jgi:4'-phosphopantetheinyl transferase
MKTLDKIQIVYAERPPQLDRYFDEVGPLLLPQTEFSKLCRYVNKSDRDLSFAGKLLLFDELDNLGIHLLNLMTLSFSTFKKPYLNCDNSPVNFNISHSGGICVLVVALDQKVGVDIEQSRPIDLRDYFSVLTARERLWIGDDPVRFFIVWTKKEALLKAIGKGFYHDPSSIDVLGDTATIDGDTFYFEELPLLDSYKCVLSFEHKKSNITIKHVEINNSFLQRISERLKQH